MNSYEYFKSIYKPYRYTKKGKCTIIYTMNGDYVIKDNKSDMKTLYNYLDSRGFTNFPKVIDESRDNTIVYEFINDFNIPKEQKSLDLANLISNLHHKTLYFKEISQDRYKNVYDNIKSNIDYLNEYYLNKYESFFKEEYHSPSHYLFIINYSKIQDALVFCHKELDNWFDIVKTKTNQRVVLNHNNLSLDHYLKSNKDYLISWDNYKIDTPVLDLVKLYQNNYLDFSYDIVLDKYLDNFPWLDDEKKLFFILISMPPKIVFDKYDELYSTIDVRKKLDYLYKTKELIRPYYTTQKEKQ